MNATAITLLATASNIGTIACIKKCKHAVSNGGVAAGWFIGIGITIVATQYLLLWADLKGVPLGFALSVVIAAVVITAAFLGVVPETGRFMINALNSISALALTGYGLVVLGVLLVGLSR